MVAAAILDGILGKLHLSSYFYKEHAAIFSDLVQVVWKC
jgi:hypothetical protein